MKKKKTMLSVLMTAALLSGCALASSAKASTPPIPPRLGVYAGPGKSSDVDAFQSWLGCSQVDATDYLDPAWTAWNPTALQDWGTWTKAQPDRNLILGLHLVPISGGTLSAGLKGAYDGQFKALAKLMVQNGLGNSTIRLGYEPNNPTIGPWQGTDSPSSYIAMFRRVHNIMKSVAPGLKFNYNPSVGPSGKAISFDSLYPGNAYVDSVGLDIYDVWWQTPNVTPAQRWNHIVTQPMGLNDFKSFAAAHGKPTSYPEWGLYAPGDDFAGGGDDPYFVDRMAEIVATAQFQSYFNLNWGGGTLDNFPNGKAEYKIKFGG